jgi:hypothetical protein
MSSRLLSCLFAATALLTVGCDDSNGLDDDEAANVRIINASPATGTVDVLVNGTEQENSSGLVYRGASEQCVRVDASEPGLTFQQTGATATIPGQTFTFDQGGRNTVVITGTNSTNLRVTTISDALTPELEPGFARIRVINGRAATNMNVTVAPWNATTTPSPQLLTAPANITAGSTATAATGWVVVPANESVAITFRQTNNTLIDVLNVLPLTEGQEAIIVAIDPAATNVPLSYISAPACGRP